MRFPSSIRTKWFLFVPKCTRVRILRQCGVIVTEATLELIVNTAAPGPPEIVVVVDEELVL